MTPNVNESLELLGRMGLSFDLLLSSTELDEALQVAQRHPGVTFVLDHLAKPNVRDGFREPWRERLVELGRVGNVYAKISGLPAEADWTSWSAKTLRPYFEIALEAFGSERLIFATDWPVCTVAGGYGTIAEAQLDFVRQLSPHEQRAVLWDNGCRAYRLTPPQPDPRHHVESAVRNRANWDD